MASKTNDLTTMPWFCGDIMVLQAISWFCGAVNVARIVVGSLPSPRGGHRCRVYPDAPRVGSQREERRDKHANNLQATLRRGARGPIFE